MPGIRVLLRARWHPGAASGALASGCWLTGSLASGCSKNDLDLVKSWITTKHLTWSAGSKQITAKRKTLRPQPTQGQKLSPALSPSSFSSRHPILLINKVFFLLYLSISDHHSLTEKLQTSEDLKNTKNREGNKKLY
jgi:hypothetical protein